MQCPGNSGCLSAISDACYCTSFLFTWNFIFVYLELHFCLPGTSFLFTLKFFCLLGTSFLFTWNFIFVYLELHSCLPGTSFLFIWNFILFTWNFIFVYLELRLVHSPNNRGGSGFFPEDLR